MRSSWLSRQCDLAVCHNKIGDVLADQGDGVGALAAYRNHLLIRETLAAHDPTSTPVAKCFG
jgi:hypothetical protein